MKYFILFNSSNFLYTIFDWALAAVCIAEHDRQGTLNGGIVAMLIIGLFFMGLTGGIGFSAIVNALTNLTTVENTAEPADYQWNIAIKVPRGQTAAQGVRTITFPDSTAKEPTMFQSVLGSEEGKSCPDQCIEIGRTFAIVTSDKYANLWDCGMYENWCQVMGQNVLGWSVPIEVGQPWFSHRAYVRGPRDEEPTSSSFFPTSVDVKIVRARAGPAGLSAKEEADYEQRLERRRRFPYLLGGAGAPRKQWAASRAGQRLPTRTP